MHPTIAIAPLALLLLAACGGDSSGESEGAATSPSASPASASASSPSDFETQAGSTHAGVVITVTSMVNVPPMADDPQPGYDQDLLEVTAVVDNQSDAAVSLEPDDVAIYYSGPMDEQTAQGAGLNLVYGVTAKCPQVFSAEVPVAERSPGELAPGTQATWVGRFACMGAAGASVEGRPYLLRYVVNGINLSGSLPEDGEDGEVAVGQTGSVGGVTVVLDSISRLGVETVDPGLVAPPEPAGSPIPELSAFQINARLINQSAETREFTADDVWFDDKPRSTSMLQSDEILGCSQHDANSLAGDMQVPGAVAPGAETVWTSTFVCEDSRQDQFRVVYEVDTLEFRGIFP